MVAIRPAFVRLELVFSIIVIGNFKFELDGDNKDPGGYLYRKEVPSSRMVNIQHPFLTLLSGIRFMINWNEMLTRGSKSKMLVISHNNKRQ